LLAGKGHEAYQEIQGKCYPFDDRKILQSIIPVACQPASKILSWYLNLREVYVGKPTTFLSTMTATLAEGGMLPDHFTIVNLPTISGDTLVQEDSAPCLNLTQIPTDPQRG